MTGKRKAEADDISGRAERTETTAGEAQTATGDDTAGTSQAPASPDVGGLPNLSSVAWSHGEFSLPHSWVPPTPMPRPPLSNPAAYWDFRSSPVGRGSPVLPQMRPLAGKRIILAGLDASNLFRGAENVNTPFTYNIGTETTVVYDIAWTSEPPAVGDHVAESSEPPAACGARSESGVSRPQTAMFLPLLENPGGSSPSVPVSGMNQTGTVQPQPQGRSIQLELSLRQPSSAVPEQQSSSQPTGGPTCQVCGHVAGSNDVCSACHTRGPPPPPGGLS